MSLLDLIEQALRRLAVPRTTTCPLCVGTERESLTYEAEQLAEHASTSHDFEDLYDFSREWAERCDSPQVIGGVDAAFDLMTELTTAYDQYAVPELSDDPRRRVVVSYEWGWTCQRCLTYMPATFATEADARAHRIKTHRCRA